mmetsp:Transcript_16969/g.38092  ORF Transcript_16969/g.38092 Transcript_16969/m.38092 type:complete len:94 (-) Transcript_16969:108-389(-)
MCTHTPYDKEMAYAHLPISPLVYEFAMKMSKSFAGDATQQDAAMPIKPYARAQNGSASGSVAAKAAVPSPCAADAVARPRVMGSRTRMRFSKR